MVSGWEAMTIDELFVLREEMAAVLKDNLLPGGRSQRIGCVNLSTRPSVTVKSLSALLFPLRDKSDLGRTLGLFSLNLLPQTFQRCFFPE